MKKENISDAMNMIDDKHIVKAQSTRNEGRISMKKKKVIFTAIAAAVLLTGGITAYAGASGGWMKDIKNDLGAITGQQYNDADTEIELHVTEADSSGITVEAVLAEPYKPPYIAIDFLDISEFRIVDENGKTVAENTDTSTGELIDGCAVIRISAELTESQTLCLVADSLTGSAKADQPLEINGTWKCTFEVK